MTPGRHRRCDPARRQRRGGVPLAACVQGEADRDRRQPQAEDEEQQDRGVRSAPPGPGRCRPRSARSVQKSTPAPATTARRATPSVRATAAATALAEADQTPAALCTSTSAAIATPSDTRIQRACPAGGRPSGSGERRRPVAALMSGPRHRRRRICGTRRRRIDVTRRSSGGVRRRDAHQRAPSRRRPGRGEAPTSLPPGRGPGRPARRRPAGAPRRCAPDRADHGPARFEGDQLHRQALRQGLARHACGQAGGALRGSPATGPRSATTTMVGRRTASSHAPSARRCGR